MKTPPSSWAITLNTRTLLAVVASVAALGLTACSSSSSDKDAPPAKNVAVTGVAAKGILQNALVEACSQADCAGVNDPIATTTTDAQGNYSLAIAANNAGNLVIRVRQQTGATMICDVPAGCNGVDFGKAVTMPTDLVLRTVTQVEASATTVSAHISPITELVTAAAIASSSGEKIKTDAIAKASSAVRTLLGLGDGLDLTKIKPVDITSATADASDSAALQLSLLSAAFANNTGGQSIKDRIQEVAQAFSSGTVAAATLSALTTGAQAALTASAAVNAAVGNQQSAINTALDTAETTATDGCAPNCTVDVDYADSSATEQAQYSANMAAVKGLVGDVRQLGWEIFPQLTDKTDPVYANGIIAQAKGAGTIVDADLSAVSAGLANVAEIMTVGILHAKGIEAIPDLAADDQFNLNKIARVLFG